jgi:hypothetical protein
MNKRPGYDMQSGTLVALLGKLEMLFETITIDLQQREKS